MILWKFSCFLTSVTHSAFLQNKTYRICYWQVDLLSARMGCSCARVVPRWCLVTTNFLVLVSGKQIFYTSSSPTVKHIIFPPSQFPHTLGLDNGPSWNWGGADDQPFFSPKLNLYQSEFKENKIWRGI